MIAEIFSYLDDAENILKSSSLEKAARVVSYMDSDDAVDVLDDLSETKKNEIVEHLDADARKMSRSFFLMRTMRLVAV